VHAVLSIGTTTSTKSAAPIQRASRPLPSRPSTSRRHGFGRCPLRSALPLSGTTNGKSVEAVVADGGPANKLGEISLACAKAIGVPVKENSAHPANSGGIAATSHVIHYRLFPGIAASVNGVTYPLQHS
jgi:hypothetical protein